MDEQPTQRRTINTSDDKPDSRIKGECRVSESFLKTSDSHRGSAVGLGNTVRHDRDPVEDAKNDRRLSLPTQTDSTRMALESGISDQILRNKRKHDDDNTNSTSNASLNKTNLLPAPASTNTIRNLEATQDKKCRTFRHKTALSDPVDPEYARILGSTTLSSNFSGIDPDVRNILSDWDTRYRGQENGLLRPLRASLDSNREEDSSSGPVSAPDNTVWSLEDPKPDDGYEKIFERHNFKFQIPPAAKRPSCRVCGKRIPAIQDPRHPRICNHCRIEKKIVPYSPPLFRKTCGVCSSDQSIDDLQMIDGRLACLDCRDVGLHKYTEPGNLDQHSDNYHDRLGNNEVQAPRKKRPSRPSDFVDWKDILKSLNKPVAARRAGPKQKSFQEEQSARSYKAILQRDQEVTQRTGPRVFETTSSNRYSQSSVEHQDQLIRLGIKTVPNGIPIWTKVSRSAPLGQMFVTGLQSDNALRDHVFMLPGQFIRWDDTPDQLGLSDDACFEMHELPRSWLPDARSLVDNNTIEASSTETSNKQASSEVKSPDAKRTLYFGQTHDRRPEKARVSKKIAYDVDIPEPVNIPNEFPSGFDMQPASSNSSTTSKFSLPKLSTTTQAELLAILDADKESTPSRTSISDYRCSPRPHAAETSLDTSQEHRNPQSQSPSVIFLHESKDEIASKDEYQRQNDMSLSERERKRLKWSEEQQEVIELWDI